MTEQVRDFWPALDFDEALRTPSAILREQASLLGSKTRNLIEAEVTTVADGPWFTIRFDLVVPALDRYRYQICVLQHDIQMYPVYVLSGLSEQEDAPGFISPRPTTETAQYFRKHKLKPPSQYQIDSEDQLVSWLEKVLSSEQMRGLLTRLLSLVRSTATAASGKRLG